MGTTIDRRIGFDTAARFADLFAKAGLSEAGRQLDELLEQLVQVSVGVPRIHADVHMGGDDSVSATSPPQQIGIAAELGDPTIGFSPGDHVHPSGLSGDGDLLTVVGGELARLPVGADHDRLSVVDGAPAWQAITHDPIFAALR